MLKKKLWYMEFDVGAWLKDPALARCSALTRGVWMDLLCVMHEENQCGLIAGTREELARLGRCTSLELDAALHDLKGTGAADVRYESRPDTEAGGSQNARCHGKVTVVSRRMRRLFNERKSCRERKMRQREREGHGNVTPPSQPLLTSSSPVKERSAEGKEGESPPSAPAENATSFAYADPARLREVRQRLRGHVAAELPSFPVFEAECQRLDPLMRGFRVKELWELCGRYKPRFWKPWVNGMVVRERRR
jgi:hypothetical protein